MPLLAKVQADGHGHETHWGVEQLDAVASDDTFFFLQGPEGFEFAMYDQRLAVAIEQLGVIA